MWNNLQITGQFLQQNLILLLITFFIFGACFGSFLNALIYRLANGINLSFPVSHCPICKNKLKFYHNIPLISWLVLRAKCAFCQIKIPRRYFLIELFTALAFILIAYIIVIKNLPILIAVKFCTLTTLLIPLFFIDLEYKYLPNKLTYTGLIIGLLFCIFLPQSNFVNGSISFHFLSTLYSFLLILLIIKIGQILRKKTIMGFGDAKLLAMFGLFFGLWFTLLILLLASICAVFCYFINKEKVIAFGCYLTTTAFFFYLIYLIIAG